MSFIRAEHAPNEICTVTESRPGRLLIESGFEKLKSPERAAFKTSETWHQDFCNIFVSNCIFETLYLLL